MFTRQEVVALTTWRAGHLLGLQVRWIDGPQNSGVIAEIFPRRRPEHPLWHLRKPAEHLLCLHHLQSGDVSEHDTLASSLSAIVSHEMAETRPNAADQSGADLSQ